MARFCTNCGSSMDESAAFCSKCGHAAADARPGGGSVATVPGAKAGGLSDNVAGMLAYFTIIPAVIFLLLEPYSRNRFVRFHAFQSVFLCLAWIIINMILRVLLPWFFWPLRGIVDLGLFVLWIVLLIKAYSGQMWKLPIVGDMAEKQANAM